MISAHNAASCAIDLFGNFMMRRFLLSSVILTSSLLISGNVLADPNVQQHQFSIQQEVEAIHATSQSIPTQDITVPETVTAPPVDLSAEQPEGEDSEIYLPETVKTIVIDAGHGGTNEGAIGIAGIHEKYLTLPIALLLADRLRSAMPDAEIILTRQHDATLSLGERIDIANQIHADLFISLHYNNSGNPDAIGFESFWAGDYWKKDLEKANIEIDDQTLKRRTRMAKLGERMAKCFNRSMRHYFDVLDRGVKSGDYTVLTRAEVPAVVLELAFLSHAQEGLDVINPSVRAKIVNALVEAVLRYASDEIL